MFFLLILLPFISFLAVALFGKFLGHTGFYPYNYRWIVLEYDFIFFWILLCSNIANMIIIIVLVVGLLVVCFLLDWCFVFDTLTVVMLVVVTVISFLVHLYSIEYMARGSTCFTVF